MVNHSLNNINKPLVGKFNPNSRKLNSNFSNKHFHLLRLIDLLNHLLTLPSNYSNSIKLIRNWRLLANFNEIELNSFWRFGNKILDKIREEDEVQVVRDDDASDENEVLRIVDDEDKEEQEEEEKLWRNNKKSEWLKLVQGNSIDKLDKFNDYILTLIASKKLGYAMEELELYLPNHPYHDSIGLNILAGQLSLLLSQPTREDSSSSSSSSSSLDSDSPETKTPLKRKHPLVEPDQDMTKLIIKCSTNNPIRFNSALEFFKRAARLEKKDDDEISLGEGTRWLNLLEPVENVSRASKARRRDFSDTEEEDNIDNDNNMVGHS